MHHFNGHFHVVLTIKIVIHCQRTLRGEGQSVDSWGIYGSVLLHTAGPKSICSGTEWPLICTVLHTANAGQYATLNCEPPLFGFPCKWQYINVLTFEPGLLVSPLVLTVVIFILSVLFGQAVQNLSYLP